MSRVRVELPSVLEPVTGGRLELELAADTFQGALRALVEELPSLRGHLFDEQGQFREHVLCFLNERNTRWLRGEDPALADGDRLRIMQAVSGG